MGQPQPTASAEHQTVMTPLNIHMIWISYLEEMIHQPQSQSHQLQPTWGAEHQTVMTPLNILMIWISCLVEMIHQPQNQRRQLQPIASAEHQMVITPHGVLEYFDDQILVSMYIQMELSSTGSKYKL